MAKQMRVLLEPDKLGKESEKLQEGMLARVVGQNEAVDKIVKVFQTFQAGMCAACKPAGSFLLLGPTGTGKTKTVEALAEYLIGDPRAMIKIDCAEFQHSHEIAKLVGSPPGYLGHRETHPLLSQESLNAHHTDKIKLSFVLFDEIEKSSDALWNLLLGILDKATMTLGDNRRVDFQRSMVFLTSNLGAREMSKELGDRIGFNTSHSKDSDIRQIGVTAARRRFTPEFMNRLDQIVVYNQLTSEHLAKILELELRILETRVSVAFSTSFAILYSQEVKNFLLEKGRDDRYGARSLKRVIEGELAHPISSLISSKQLRAGDVLMVEMEGDGVRFYRDVRKEAVA